MLKALRSERIKYRGTFTPWLTVLAPLALCLFSWLPHILGDWSDSWPHQLMIIGNWWPVLWVPFGAALLAALAVWQDGGGTWRIVRARQISPGVLYGAKAIVVAGYFTLSSALLFAFTLIMGKLSNWSQPVPWGTLSLAVLVPWAGGLAVLAIELWLASAKGFGAAFGLAVLGFLAGIAAAEQPAWVCVPWAWGIRGAIPVIGTHANGLPMAAGDPLWDTSVTGLAIALGLVAALGLGTVGAVWFSRREVQ